MVWSRWTREARMPRLVHVAAGTIRLSKKEKTPQRLAQVYAELTALLALHQPEVVAIEEVFFSANVKSALKLGQVRGVAMLAAASCGLPVAEYAPLSIKSSVVGYGLAAKEQVQFMVTRLLGARPGVRFGRCRGCSCDCDLSHPYGADTAVTGCWPMRLSGCVCWGLLWVCRPGLG